MGSGESAIILQILASENGLLISCTGIAEFNQILEEMNARRLLSFWEEALFSKSL